MVRAAAKNHPSVAVVTSPVALRRRPRRGRATAASTSTTRKRLAGRGVRAHRRLRRRRRLVVRVALRARPTTSAFPQFLGATLRSAPTCCATARTRTRPPRSTRPTSSGPGLAQAEQLHGKEMSYNNYVDADAARRAAYDHRRARASRSSSTPTRAASRSAPTSPRRTARRTRATRCPRSAASSPPTDRSPCAMAEQVAEIFTEVVVAPAFEPTARRDPQPQEEHPAARRSPSARRRAQPSSARSAAACCSSSVDARRRRRRRPGDLDARRPARPPTPRRSPTSRSPGGPAAR